MKNIIFKMRTYYEELPHALRKALLVFIVVRILVSTSGLVGLAGIPSRKILPAEGYAKPAYSKSFENLFGLWERSDAIWYMKIARYGYSKDGYCAAFFPLYPLAIRILHALAPMPFILCALAVSNICFLAALYFIYCITEKLFDEKTAEKTIWYQALFPGSIFMFAPYTESLFLMLFSASYFAALNKKWSTAAICAALMGAVRNLGVLMSILLVVEFFRQRLQEKNNKDLKQEKTGTPLTQLLWLLLTPSGLLAVMVFWYRLSGDPLRFLHAQSGWQRSFFWPWTTLYQGIIQAWKLNPAPPAGVFYGVFYMETAAVVLFVVMGVIGFKKLPISLSLSTWLFMLPSLCYPFMGRIFMSNLRFLAVIFPCFLLLSLFIKNKDTDFSVKLLFACLSALSSALYVTSNNMF